MAEYHQNHQREEAVETADGRGLLDFAKKKDEEDDVISSSEFEEKVMVSSDQNQEKNHHIHEQLHSSCRDEEKIEEKLPISDLHDDDEQDKVEMDTQVPIEKIHVEEEDDQGGDDVACTVPPPPAQQEEKKGFLEKIKNKIPGFQSKPTTTTTCEGENEKANECEWLLSLVSHICNVLQVRIVYLLSLMKLNYNLQFVAFILFGFG
ncbi:hypothetical protein V2J09_023938 [Rumex salicifolius]